MRQGRSRGAATPRGAFDLLWLVSATVELAWGGPQADCDIYIPRQPLGDGLSRVVPAPGAAEVSVVVQDGPVIRVYTFNEFCIQLGDQAGVQVFQSDDFWADTDGGLADAVAWSGQHKADKLIVAWTLGGDVYLSIVSGNTVTSPVLVNHVSTLFRHRREVTITPVEAKVGGAAFIVAWESWAQDGSAWGIFARRFTEAGVALGDEWQVNQYWQQFQWQPQLHWCGSTAWALWTNGTGEPCGGEHPPAQCATGPMLRSLNSWLVKASVHPAEESLGAMRPLASSLSCVDDGLDQALVFWLEQGDSGLIPKSAMRAPPGTNGSHDASPSRQSAGRWPVRPAAAPPWRGLGSWLRQALQSEGAVPAPPLLLRAPPDGPRGGAGLTGAAREQGGLYMLTTSNFLLLLLKDSAGSVECQLSYFNFTDKASGGDQPDIYPPRILSPGGSSNVRAVWQTGRSPSGQALSLAEQAAITCFTAGGALGASKPLFVCMRRRVSWLAGTDGLNGLGMGMTLALGMMCFLLVVFCVIRICAVRRMTLGRGLLLAGAGGGVNRPRLRELREQLARIPQAPPMLPPAPPPAAAAASAAADCEGPAAVPGLARAGEAECPICQNEVSVRVAFRPCGHTACRDCIMRIVEINQTCHICRAAIEGVQPVYI